ncbi:MAG: thermonuclease family protein [Planctomycetaceae bacterium]|nr:thermonuclease family protein [Planctomycetaceae bacterium]
MQKEIRQLVRQLFFKQTRRGKVPKGWIGLLLLTVFGIILVLSTPKERSLPSSDHKWGEVRVERCVDGDTIIVEGKIRVRLIGANTPETVKPNWPVEPFGPEASEFTKTAIENAGNQVRLESDGDQTDRYKRQLAMVYVDGVLLNEELIRQGLAVAETQYRYSKEMKTRFKAAEEEAKKAKRGIWSLTP